MLPVKAPIGGSKGGSLKLKTDMSGISGGKPTKAAAPGKKVGSISKGMPKKSGSRKSA